MIRIDEIYSNIFWPWIRSRRPGTRLYYCDPFGSTDVDHLFNFGDDDIPEWSYVFMHDQEPIQLPAHKHLFDKVLEYTHDIPDPYIDAPGTVIVSEQGSYVSMLESNYGWKAAYYFFHGWACLDWYRGYHRSFLFPDPSHREMPSKTFMSPNRIIGGQRDHRVLFIYHVIKRGLQNNHISAPLVCPVEDQELPALAFKYNNRYPDISQVLSAAELPWLFADEHTQLMTSCWLGNFREAVDSMIYVPTETVYFGRRTHITEKTFKAIALGMPFVLVATAGSLEYMRSYGFRTFGEVWDESYDHELDDFKRLELVSDLLQSIDQCSLQEKKQIFRHAQSIAQHNWNHFYHGGFESVLWRELQELLHGL